MKIDLTGRTALVTGSTDGIGFAAAKGLAAAGASVIVNGRSRDKTEAAAARIGGRTRGVAADLADAAGAEALFAAVPDAHIVVSNAGIFEPADFFDTDDGTWDRHWQVNVMAGVRLARHYLPQMKPGQSLEEAGAEFVKANRPSSIIGRAASTEEVANMIVYTCSTQASATTGAALRVDGGIIDTLM